MPVDQVEALRVALRPYDGVPTWWAELFVNLGLTQEEAVAWVRAAERDSNSVLTRCREKEMNATLQGYARARGIALMGVGDGDMQVTAKTERLVHRISTIVTPQEQEAIVAEVGMYADVEFREKVNGIYSQHAVANAVRSVHGAYLTKVVGNATVLEAGASVKSAVLAGVDTKTRHCCSPVLDARDSVRHSLKGWLESVARNSSKYSDKVRRAAFAAMDPATGFVCQNRSQDCTKQVEVICSNESTHDVPFDDLPLIMARHGARLWTGFMTRAPGVRSVGGPNQGESPALGTRWRLNRAKDEIVFHFNKDASFSYVHKFSQWVKYEEQFGFRWRGQFFDYVYTRLPITTKSCLAFVVARVPKTTTLLREPVYKESGSAGMINITSIRVVGGCLNTKKPRFEPCNFDIDEVVFDRALEMRLAQGDRGNLASTMSYLRSARVKMAMNGVDLGVVTTVPVAILEPAAVAVEVLAADSRKASARDYDKLMEVAVSHDAFVSVLGYFSGVSSVFNTVTNAARGLVRGALADVLNGRTPVVVKATRCSPYVKVTEGLGEGKVAESQQMVVDGCGCSELADVVAALRVGEGLSNSDRKQLEAYASELRAVASKCVAHDAHKVEQSEADDAFYDAFESLPGDVSEAETVTATTFVDSGDDTSSVAGESSASSVCESLYDNGSVSSVVEVDESRTISAMKEYARWAQLSAKCARTEAAVNSDVMFLVGTPTMADIERSTTARTRHAVVVLKGGRFGKVMGTLREEDNISEVYVRSLGRTCKVYKDAAKRMYIRESVNELAYTGSGLAVVNGDEISRGVMKVLQELPRGFSFPKYEFVMGVPGAGKTYRAIKMMEKFIEQGKSVMYLTATVASKDDVEMHMAKKYGANAMVSKTYDSYVIHGAEPVGGGSFDLLIMDEAPMAHKGELFTCMAKACAREVKLFGDAKQIPWLAFMAGFEAKYAIVDEDEFSYTMLSETHRFGEKTCAMWLDVYGVIYPCECCEHEDIEPEVVRVTSMAGVAKCDEGKTLVFTQEERVTAKREGGFTDSIVALKKRDKGGLSTVAEDQGGTHKDVCVVRLQNKKAPKESKMSPAIWNREPWVLVATTRHKRKLVYYTTSADDLVWARIDLAKCRFRLEAVKAKAHWDTVSHKAAVVRSFGV